MCIYIYTPILHTYRYTHIYIYIYTMSIYPRSNDSEHKPGVQNGHQPNAENGNLSWWYDTDKNSYSESKGGSGRQHQDCIIKWPGKPVWMGRNQAAQASVSVFSALGATRFARMWPTYHQHSAGNLSKPLVTTGNLNTDTTTATTTTTTSSSNTTTTTAIQALRAVGAGVGWLAGAGARLGWGGWCSNCAELVLIFSTGAHIVLGWYSTCAPGCDPSRNIGGERTFDKN